MKITTDAKDGVLMLKALPGATGTYKVSVADGLGGPQSFTITVRQPVRSAEPLGRHGKPD